MHERGADFAASIWVIDPVFMLDAIREQLEDSDGTVAREQSYFTGARLDDADLRAAGEQDRAQRADARARQIEATRSNLGLGHDLRAGLIDPTDAQLQALKVIVCHLLVRHQREVIAYGAGWSDREHQQPVGDSGRREPRQTDAIADAELQRALDDPDPLRGIAGLVARWSAAFVLDPDGVTRTKALGSERMARRLRDALPGGQHPLRAAVWEFLRPMLSPLLVELHRDAFVIDDGPRARSTSPPTAANRASRTSTSASSTQARREPKPAAGADLGGQRFGAALFFLPAKFSECSHTYDRWRQPWQPKGFCTMSRHLPRLVPRCRCSQSSARTTSCQPGPKATSSACMTRLRSIGSHVSHSNDRTAVGVRSIEIGGAPCAASAAVRRASRSESSGAARTKRAVSTRASLYEHLFVPTVGSRRGRQAVASAEQRDARSGPLAGRGCDADPYSGLNVLWHRPRAPVELRHPRI